MEISIVFHSQIRHGLVEKIFQRIFSLNYFLFDTRIYAENDIYKITVEELRDSGIVYSDNIDQCLMLEQYTHAIDQSLQSMDIQSVIVHSN